MLNTDWVRREHGAAESPFWMDTRKSMAVSDLEYQFDIVVTVDWFFFVVVVVVVVYNTDV